MNTYTTEMKYLKVIEIIGEVLLKKDEELKFSKYEIEALKKKIERIESYIEFYSKDEEKVS